jgi:dTDP-4-amino-4,6-dideoxygalactose transaminase
MYDGGLVCLSFHAKKLLPIGRGGMILTDDYEAYKWLKKARFDGRDEVPLGDDELTQLGWNMYMTPEQASRGLMLFDVYKNHPKLPLKVSDQGYPDLSKFKIYET